MMTLHALQEKLASGFSRFWLLSLVLVEGLLFLLLLSFVLYCFLFLLNTFQSFLGCFSVFRSCFGLLLCFSWFIFWVSSSSGLGLAYGF
jgi:hypothetical protein